MKTLIPAALMLLISVCTCPTQAEEETVKNIYDIEVKTISGEAVKLEHYKGKVLLIVNTASKCGFTKQYDGLQSLYENFQEQGLVVLGFPSNDFMKQEPGTNEEISTFCRVNFGVTFPMFEKISVKGKSQHPLYTYLTSKHAGHEFGGKISWNFNKFLISRDGRVVNRFGSKTKPSDEKLVNAIKKQLDEK